MDNSTTIRYTNINLVALELFKVRNEQSLSFRSKTSLKDEEFEFLKK